MRELTESKITCMQLILVMSVERAEWFSADEGGIRHLKVQNFGFDAAEMIQIPDCIFSNQTPVRLEVIVDTNLDDVDRVKLAKQHVKIFRKLRILHTLRELKKEYPEADVHPLQKVLYPEIASILHSAIPEICRSRLGDLQKQNIVISHLATHHQVLSQSTRKSFNPVLFLLPSDGDSERHFVAIDGVPLLLRRLSHYDDRSRQRDSSELLKTIIHLSSLLHPWRSSVTVLSPVVRSDCPAVAFKLYVERYIGVKNSGVIERQLSMVDYDAGSTEDIDRSAASKMLIELSTESNDGTDQKSSKVELSTKYSRADLSRFSVCRVSGMMGDVLSTSKKFIEFERRRRFRLALVLAAAALIIIALVYTSYLGGNYHYEKRAIHAERAALSHSISYLAESIKRINQFPGGLISAPHDIVHTVAALIQDLSAIRVKKLAWLVEEELSNSSEILVDRASNRSRDWTDDFTPSRLSVEIVGEFSEDVSLRQSQAMFDELLSRLNKNSDVESYETIRSPMGAAYSSSSTTAHKIEFALLITLKAT